MKKILFSLILFSSPGFVIAQKSEKYQSPGKESKAYQLYRDEITTPEFGLKKVQQMIRDSLPKETFRNALDEKKYQSLSLREKFTYNMIHPESYTQICNAMLMVADAQKKIFAELPLVLIGYNFSKRQVDFFRANRDSVIGLMSSSVLKTKRIGLNYKRVIAYIDAKPMIPLLIKTYRIEKKDHDILTLLMLLMKDNKYAEFINSSLYKNLYAATESSYRTYIDFNSANEESIIKMANSFYNELSK